ncbi:MAG: hypothetical protein ABIN39_08185 [candidate division WOR-3 bacterium]
MIFFIVFLVYLTLISSLFLQIKGFNKFLTITSFINGILQSFVLFLIFLNLLINVKYEKGNVNYDTIRMIYFFEFLILNFSNFFLFVVYKRFHENKFDMVTILKQLVQIFLPVIILNSLLILVSKMDFFENGYVFFKFLERNFFIVFFKSIYFLSFFLFLKEFFNNKEQK